MEVVDYFLTGAGHALYQPTTIESLCLQFRKILELIAMASLVANTKEYSRVHKDFQRHWNAELLLKDLERVNPRFYPQPIKEITSKKPGIKTEQEELKEGVLTRKEFIKIYKKCGAILHADNPLGRSSNYKYYERVMPEWLSKIIALLNCHNVRLVDQDRFWLIHMTENDDEVHYYEFKAIG
jgi:hypothetical protein